MDMTTSQLLIWVIVGALAGSLAAILIKRDRKGYGMWANIGIGMIGALIGGAIFDFLEVDLGLGDITISFEDLAAAFVGSLLLLAVLTWRR